MNKQQIRWASQHDWFIRSEGNKVVCSDNYSDGCKGEVVFDNFQALYEWAGY